MTPTRGTVLEGTGGVWRVHADGAVVEATLRGKLKREDDPAPVKLAVGDVVDVVADDRATGWVITAIHPRRSALSRRVPGGKRGERVVIANVDQVVTVVAAAHPDPNPRMLDRFLTIAEANDVPPLVVINKVELADPVAVDALARDYEAAGYAVHRTSVKRAIGITALRDALHGRTSAVTGPSGVGKSSLLNAMHPGLTLRVGEVSAAVNKGRHTTVGALLVPLPDGGFVGDTPGLREVGLWGIDPRALDQCFPEFAPYRGTCRFPDCTHAHEPGCAVLAAVAAGTLSAARHDSYVTLRAELAEAEATRYD